MIEKSFGVIGEVLASGFEMFGVEFTGEFWESARRLTYVSLAEIGIRVVTDIFGYRQW